MPASWKKIMLKRKYKKTYLVRRYFEPCVFLCLVSELKSVDLFVEDSNSYSDFREKLLPDTECQSMTHEYCSKVNIPETGINAVKTLKQLLIDKAHAVDVNYSATSSFSIDEKGHPSLKRRKKGEHVTTPLEDLIRSRMPKRNLIDILVNAHHYTGWAETFGSISGSEPKLQNAMERYIFTTFAYGTCMGPKQAEQHIKANISAHMLSWVNCRHVNQDMQNKALEKLINHYKKFELTEKWGLGESLSGDGTLRKILKENLIAEYHIRYGCTGGIAYHHIADNYIALFATLFPCGIWEGIAIIEGLLKNKSKIQPNKVHGDTQGQSSVVFAMTYLMGVKLMPRIRNWKDIKFFRADKKIRYKSIDSLFTDVIDWDIIERHWTDMMQVMLSLKTGTISSMELLRKFGVHSKKNKLYRAFRELGYVIRTLFMLDYISDMDLRESITVQTNKSEAYNGFSEWLSFGNPFSIVASNDPEEHEKAIKYNAIIANAVMLQNVIDISNIILELYEEGVEITLDDLKHISPLMTEHIMRFGIYIVDLLTKPKNVKNSMKLPLKFK
jgi:TnpA family transposase